MYLEAKTEGFDCPCFGKFDSAQISPDGIRRLFFKGDFEVISVGGGCCGCILCLSLEIKGLYMCTGGERRELSWSCYHLSPWEETGIIGTWRRSCDCENLPGKLYPFSKVRRQRVLGKDVKRDPLQAEEQG